MPGIISRIVFVRTNLVYKFPDPGAGKSKLSPGAIPETIGTINPRLCFEQTFGKLLAQFGGVFVPDLEEQPSVPKREASLVMDRHRKPVNGSKNGRRDFVAKIIKGSHRKLKPLSGRDLSAEKRIGSRNDFSPQTAAVRADMIQRNRRGRIRRPDLLRARRVRPRICRFCRGILFLHGFDLRSFWCS